MHKDACSLAAHTLMEKQAYTLTRIYLYLHSEEKNSASIKLCIDKDMYFESTEEEMPARKGRNNSTVWEK